MSVIQNPNGWDVVFGPNPTPTGLYNHEIEPGAPNFPIVTSVRLTGGVDVTVTVTGHPLFTGSIIYYNGGLATSGVYAVTVIDANNFTLNGTAGGIGSNAGGFMCAIYDAVGGNVGFWVGIPTLSHTVDTVFYMFYNKAGVTSSPENIAAVWPSPATAIYHLPRGDPFQTPPHFFTPDSTGNFDATVAAGGLTQETGQIQKGMGTGGLFHIENDTFPDLPAATYSISCWIFLPSSASGSFQSFCDLQTAGGGGQVGYGVKPGGVPYLVTHGVTEYDFNSLSVPYDTWVQISYLVTLTDTTCNVFVPGSGITSQTQATTPKSGVVGKLTGFTDLNSGAFADELELYADGITTDRFHTMAVNQSDATFITIGPELPGAGGYNFSRTITVDHTKVVGSDWPDFALLINTLLPVGGLPPINPTIACALSSATVGVPYSSSVMASGGTPPYTYSIIAGSLPTGLTLDTSTGAITGTPTTAGSSSYTPEVTDSLGNSGQIDCSITVSAPSLTCSINVGTQGASYSSFVQVIGGTAPYAFSIISGSLPPGLSLDPVTGAITGIPTTTGAYSYEVQVVDSSSNTLHTNCGISVEPPVIGAYFELIRCIPTFKPARHLPVRGSAK